LVISDTFHHDTCFVQHFLDKIFLDKETGWLEKKGLRGRPITNIMINSDGAASQFKQKGTLYHGTVLKDKHGDWLEDMSWSFGAPGHGKGTWDGLGGIFKNRRVFCSLIHSVFSKSNVVRSV